MTGKTRHEKYEELIRENARLSQENNQLRQALFAMQARFAAPAFAAPAPRDTPPIDYMSGRWHRRSGDVYGIVTQSPGVKDADGSSGDL